MEQNILEYYITKLPDFQFCPPFIEFYFEVKNRVTERITESVTKLTHYVKFVVQSTRKRNARRKKNMGRKVTRRQLNIWKGSLVSSKGNLKIYTRIQHFYFLIHIMKYNGILLYIHSMNPPNMDVIAKLERKIQKR